MNEIPISVEDSTTKLLQDFYYYLDSDKIQIIQKALLDKLKILRKEFSSENCVSLYAHVHGFNTTSQTIQVENYNKLDTPNFPAKSIDFFYSYHNSEYIDSKYKVVLERGVAFDLQKINDLIEKNSVYNKERLLIIIGKFVICILTDLIMGDILDENQTGKGLFFVDSYRALLSSVVLKFLIKNKGL